MEEETMMENQVTTATEGALVFVHLPGFARFIKDNCLVPYIQEQLLISRQVNLPLLKFFAHIPEDELITMSMVSNREFLTCVEENRLTEQIQKSLEVWKADQLNGIRRDEITAEDITLAGYMRKKAMLKFLPSYTTDVYEAVEITKEIDAFTVASETASTNLFIQLLRDRIKEQTHFSEIISSTTPGLNYVFSLSEYQIKYTNKNYLDFFGHTFEELQAMHGSILSELIHPDDIETTQDGNDRCMQAADGEIVQWEFRLKQRSGQYCWMRNYASVFKRDEDGRPTEIVGLILDVDNEKKTADKLQQSEKQLLDAQEQAQLGSFELDIATGKMTVTPQFKAIYELSDFDLYKLIDHVHPADRDRVNANRNRAIEKGGIYDNEYRYLINGKEKVIWSKGIVTYKDGRQVMNGTAMDVTSRNKLVQELTKSRDLYQQAQQVAHIGNWTFDLETNEATWSEELFRIYEMEVPEHDHVQPEETRNLRHPDDFDRVEEEMRILREEHLPRDYNFRIVLPGGKIKHLNVKGNVTRDDSGKVVQLVGVVQDITERQIMIEKLQQSDALFNQAQELSHMGNWNWDLVTGKIEWSKELYKIYGIEVGTPIVFDEVVSFNHPDDVALMKQVLRKAKETLEPADSYYHITLKDGTKKVLHFKTETVASNGVATKMVGTIQDVTEKQTLIEQLQRSETLFKQAQAISHIGNWSWNFETRQLAWSDELYRIYELEPGSVETSEAMSLYNHPDDDIEIKNTIRKAIEAREPFELNYRIILKDGRTKILNARGEIKPYAKDRLFNVYGTVQDITDQKNNERQLKEYQEFIEKITDVTPSIIAAYNIHTGQYSFINDAVEKLLGYSPALIMEEGAAFMSSIIHPDDVATLQEKNAKGLEDANLLSHNDNEPIIEFKYRMRNKDGKYRWFHTYGTIFERNAAGMVDSVLNISVDITEQEEAEQSLFRKNMQLQQSNTSLEEYAYVASHDLKEPLRKIATFSDRILTTQYATLNDEGKLYFSKIIQSTDRMQKMIGDLLSVSTILGNTAYETCNLQGIFAEALQPLDHKIEETAAVIVAEDLPVIQAVPSQFRQLFQNLIGNSLKFARPGVPPHITISAKTLGPKTAEQYDIVKAKKYHQITLQDNGIGFDNQYAAKIFAIFQRLHAKAEYDGTGIGLAICKKVVENHSGIIFAQGKQGAGATFTIILPA